MGVDREYLSDADPIAFDANEDRSRTGSSVMLRLSVKQREWFTASGTMNWQTPQELPDLRRVGIVALDTETRDAGLQTDRGSSWPTPPLDGRVICVRCAPVLWGCGGTERGQ